MMGGDGGTTGGVPLDERIAMVNFVRTWRITKVNFWWGRVRERGVARGNPIGLQGGIPTGIPNGTR